MAKRSARTGEVKPILPASHLIALQRAGFTVISYLNESVRVVDEDGQEHSEWLPRLCVAPGDSPNSYRVIEWLQKNDPQNHNSFSGWQTYHGRSCGGMNYTIGQALGWFAWYEAQKRGPHV